MTIFLARQIKYLAQSVTLISTALLAWTTAYGQTDTVAKKNMFAVKTDLFFPTVGIIGGNTMFTLTAERGFKQRHSVELTGQYMNFHSSNWDETYIFILEEYKLFWSNKKYFRGFYSGASAIQFVNHYIFDHGNVYDEGNEFWMGGGIIQGYQNYIKKRFVIDVLAGIGIVRLIEKMLF